jgi:hypothetical protein
MTNTLIKEKPVTIHTIVFDESIDVLKIPQRSYDFNKGDRRFEGLETALAHAEKIAGLTGVRQIVRKDSPGDVAEWWLVQAIGS